MRDQLKGIGSPVPEVQPVRSGICRDLHQRSFSSDLPLVQDKGYPTLRKPEGCLLMRYFLF